MTRLLGCRSKLRRRSFGDLLRHFTLEHHAVLARAIGTSRQTLQSLLHDFHLTMHKTGMPTMSALDGGSNNDCDTPKRRNLRPDNGKQGPSAKAPDRNDTTMSSTDVLINWYLPAPTTRRRKSLSHEISQVDSGLNLLHGLYSVREYVNILDSPDQCSKRIQC